MTTTPQPQAVRVFLSYSHQDEAWKDRVALHLGVLARDGRLEVWQDRRIQAGTHWRAQIEQALQACDTALLLVSAHFLTSAFILDQEVPPLLDRCQREGTRVVPLILRPCAWTQIAWLASLQARPRDGRPLSAMSDNDAEQALADLAVEILATPKRAAAQVGRVVPASHEETGTHPPRPELTALAIWREKLAFLLSEEAQTADAEQKFALRQRIAEARAKIRELGGV